MAASKILSSLQKVDMTLLKEDAHYYWMIQQRSIKRHSEKIIIVSDIEEQRKQFYFSLPSTDQRCKGIWHR